ncbi:glycoside hydrolase family 3 C-terminal domain-containing protein [Parasphingopyxis sp.]|uniref:beta-glucosidase family protein n=1 Tax=Parasphingopyxis sp. TaxID=1920299 RepID=UPI00263908A4|nr:glycoside hydrolase family 3 C-terminal domain-containing protein [Parasphingopyxis sp.]
MTDYTPRKGMTGAEIADTVDAILAEATLEEKVGMMSGRGFLKQIAEDEGVWGARPYRAGGGIERLGVPCLWFTDGPRGVARGQSTAFPCSMARGASFDIDLERRIGEAMGIEIRAQDCNLSGAVCINLLRHPAWGRAQETYGEDPYHLGEMGAALATGIQTHNVVATVKHFALNSIENTRFQIDVTIGERALHEVYLPHFKRVLDAGCASVMSAYNKLNGEYCGQHRILLTDILRGDWGFDGFVHSDWMLGVYKPYGASAGLDVENPEPMVYGEKLIAAVEAGHVEPEVIDRACRRILTTLYRFMAAQDPLENYAETMVACESHRMLAREAAEKSAVLLKNDKVLPLDKDQTAKLAVLGRLAATENTGDHGSSRVRAPYVVTPLQGLRDYLGENAIVTGVESELDAARQAASEANAVVVVVGYTADDEGEFIPGNLVPSGMSDQLVEIAEAVGRDRPNQPRGGDRATLDLPDDQIALIDAAAESGKPVIVVIVAGSAVMVESWQGGAAAILQTFYAGMEGGHALARLLFGDVSPSGKLPFTVARDGADYPFFDRTAMEITYDLWHGYTKFERDGTKPRYPFGHGLSYATFGYRGLQLRETDDAIIARVSVTNSGESPADEIVQLYVGAPGEIVDRPAKLLMAFDRVALEPGETQTIVLSVDKAQLRYWDETASAWRLEAGRYRISVGGSSDDSALLTAELDL